MEMKWHPIIDGDLNGIPRDEDLLFTVFDEEDGETYVISCWIEEEFENHISVMPNGIRFYKPKDVMEWMDLPLPYKTKNKCSNCKHREEWCDDIENTNPSEEDMEFLRRVFKTYYTINGKKTVKTDKQIVKWLSSDNGDSAKYKMWGNGVALLG